MKHRLIGLALIALACAPHPAESASHQWRFTELFSDATGAIQFIEMQECCGFTSELELSGKWILTTGAATKYNFRSNLTGNTARKFLLLGTAAFAALPNAPTPDFIIPSNFLPTSGDVLEYWMYGDATWGFGALPTDGTHSLLRAGESAINSPTNYAGETGSVDATTPVEGITWGRIKALLAAQ